MKGDLQKKRDFSPRALDEQSSSDETSEPTESSTHGNNRYKRDRRTADVDHIDRKYEHKSSGRDKERDSYRTEQRRKSNMRR